MSLLIGVLFLAVALAETAAASTATLTYEGPTPGLERETAYVLAVVGGGDESNRFAVTTDARGYAVTDAGGTIVASVGCVNTSANEVHCATPELVDQHSVYIDGGAGPDHIAVAALPLDTLVELRGGRGDDLIWGSERRDYMFGGSGRDGLAGGAGADSIDGGSGDDVIHGGDGYDRVSYQDRREPVEVDLAAGVGGGRGELDSLQDLEEVIGGRGADVLKGDDGPNGLAGGEGRAHDVVRGRGGNDALVGHRLYGGPGDDGLDGRIMSCGPGVDTLYRGLYKARGPFARTCELAIAGFVVVAPHPVRSGRRHVEIELRCTNAPCEGWLEVRDGRGRLGRSRFSFPAAPPGRSLTSVRVRFDRRSSSRTVAVRLTGPRARDRDGLRVRLR